ncbi:MAG: DNA-3-methyladenine glycosylase [Methanomassiliicoccus sp.]|nr:DNA-3-methyladenine glycosylase [Methanomassiliicoccus sp.]
MDRKLGREFFGRPAVEVARDIVGKVLVRASDEGTVSGTIVEAEAYSGVNDPASHTYGGRRTVRNEVLWGPSCHAYIYSIYGKYLCFNITCSREGDPQGVFVRAVRPIDGVDLMAHRRGLEVTDERSLRQLCNGPSKLCIAFAIDRSLNGADACGDVLYLEDGGVEGRVVAAPRVGVDYAGDAAAWPWRFLVENDPFVSRRPRL